MRRWSFHSLSLVSYIILIVTCFSWLESWNCCACPIPFAEIDVGHFRGYWFIGKGEADVVATNTSILMDVNSAVGELYLDSMYNGRLPLYAMDLYWRPQTSGEWIFVMQPWFVFLGSSVLPVIWLIRIKRIQRRRQWASLNRCAKCGYDLRATSGQCPECGTEVHTTELGQR